MKGEKTALKKKLNINLKPDKIAVFLIMAAIVVGAVFTAVSGYKATHISDEKLAEFREAFDLPRHFMNIASAGCCGKTANTFESFYAAYKSGATCIEVNVAFRDGETPVLARGNEFVTERSDTLEKVLDFVKEHDFIRLLLNLKEFTNTDAVFSMINKYGLAEYVYISDVDADSAGFLAERYQNIHLLLTVPDKADLSDEGVCASLVDSALKYGAAGFKCDMSRFSDEFGEMLRQKLLAFIITGVQSKYQMYEALSLNPDGILTPHPKVLYDLMQSEELFKM